MCALGYSVACLHGLLEQHRRGTQAAQRYKGTVRSRLPDCNCTGSCRMRSSTKRRARCNAAAKMPISSQQQTRHCRQELRYGGVPLRAQLPTELCPPPKACTEGGTPGAMALFLCTCVPVRQQQGIRSVEVRCPSLRKTSMFISSAPVARLQCPSSRNHIAALPPTARFAKGRRLQSTIFPLHSSGPSQRRPAH